MTQIEEIFCRRCVRLRRVGIYVSEKCAHLVCRIDLPDLAREPFETAIPMHRDEVDSAASSALQKEVSQPVKSSRRTRNSWCAQLDSQLLQRLHLRLPRLCRRLRVHARPTVITTVRLVESQHVCDVHAAIYQALDCGVEVVVGRAGAPELWDELQAAVVEVACGTWAIIIVPSQIAIASRPVVVVGRILSLDIDDAAFGGGEDDVLCEGEREDQ